MNFAPNVISSGLRAPAVVALVALTLAFPELPLEQDILANSRKE